MFGEFYCRLKQVKEQVLHLKHSRLDFRNEYQTCSYCKNGVGWLVVILYLCIRYIRVLEVRGMLSLHMLVFPMYICVMCQK